MATHASAVQAGHCPKCGSADFHTPKYTWWGGLLGPKMFSHVVCRGCKTGFNSKTGKSNAMPITIYVVVSLAIVIGLATYAGNI